MTMPTPQEKELKREFSKRIVFLYMKALEGVKLPEKAWKKLARVNQLTLDSWKK